MIPKRRTPIAAPAIAIALAQDCPPIRHTAVDYEFVLTAHLESFSIVDNSGSVEELADRYLLTDAAGHREIFKTHLILLRRFEREWFTNAPAINAPFGSA